MSESSERQARNVLPDLIIPAIALAFAGYYLTTITEVPWTSQASAVTVSALLIAAIAAFAIRTIYRVRKGSEYIALDLGKIDRAVNLKRAALLALTVGYVSVIGHLGFTITTAVFVFCGIVLLSSLANWRAALAVALSCSILGYVVFIYFFQTRFPRGPVEQYLKGLL